ncbi:hypothetical protein D9M72_519430 [compost metagenome]
MRDAVLMTALVCGQFGSAMAVVSAVHVIAVPSATWPPELVGHAGSVAAVVAVSSAVQVTDPSVTVFPFSVGHAGSTVAVVPATVH